MQEIKSFEENEEKNEEREKPSESELNKEFSEDPLHVIKSEERWKIKP